MTNNQLETEVFHWRHAVEYRGCMICPSYFEDDWYGNYVDWWGDVEQLEEWQFGTAENAIAAAKAKIDEKIRQFILDNVWSAIADLHELGVIHVPEA